MQVSVPSLSSGEIDGGAEGEAVVGEDDEGLIVGDDSVVGAEVVVLDVGQDGADGQESDDGADGQEPDDGADGQEPEDEGQEADVGVLVVG